MGIPDHLTYLLRNLYAGQEVTELDMEQRTSSKLGKEYIKVVYCYPAYLISMQSTLCKMPGWMEHKLESRLREKYQQSLICRWHQPYGRKWRGIKEPLDENERGEWKSWLKAQHSDATDHGIQPHHFMQIDGETVEIVADFILGGSRITADGDYSQEIKRCLLLGRKVMTNLDSTLKSRDITLPTKVHPVKTMVFFSSHVWMWELD